ncbi:unannotated protein [freshwater metagenome]|uniref:Unannotated protein n=1 Tax=freshwater metagenome TaxID=449393 RepID=A0A6J7Q9J0_9ZZZZ
MPPVFGPRSPSNARLKSCAGCIAITRVPSLIPKSETSGPSRNSSMTTRGDNSACSIAALRSSVTTTPLPAASPSCLTTYGAPKVSSADSTSDLLVHVNDLAVGTPASLITFFAKSFEPSNCAAACDGPKQAIPATLSASDKPLTRGFSGPTTTKSIRHFWASETTAELSSTFIA